ncbi:MAG TPA: sigma-70 family RNA polymerase sigma factor [Bdellovibrionales bacterium]|nr:sigma-70 family RNA polymerase sigma factor [Bdellovibrionales bacterium]
MKAAAQTDNEALQILLENHSEFRRFLAKHVESEAVAEDLLQDAMERAISRQDDLSDTENVVAWFYRVVRNVLIDHYRSKGASKRKTDKFLEELLHLEQDRTPPDDELKAAVCACFRRLLPALKPEYAELIEKIDLGGQAQQDVAKSLGVTPNNLTVRLHRARQALKERLKQSCGTCTEHGCLDCSCA